MTRMNQYTTNSSATTAQELVTAYSATGTIEVVIATDANKIIGTTTEFTTELKVNDIIIANSEQHRIRSIQSDTELTVHDSFVADVTAGSSLTYYPQEVIRKGGVFGFQNLSADDIYIGFSRAGDGSDISPTANTILVEAGILYPFPLTGQDLRQYWTYSAGTSSRYVIFTN